MTVGSSSGAAKLRGWVSMALGGIGVYLRGCMRVIGTR